MMKKVITIITAAVILAALIYSCANQAAPSGGPEDKTPPEADRSFPEHGQLNVDPRSSISILFSEWLSPATAQRAVSVYPTLPKGVTVKAAKDRIKVTPKEPLNANTTYQIVIATTLQDLRGNSPTEPIIIVFSTGAEIDSGRIDGVVMPYGKKLAPPPRISLFYEGDVWDNSKYFALPDYAAQSDSAGAFKFSFLREGRYRAVAFVDEFRTSRMRSGDECYTPVEQTITVTKNEQTVMFYPSDCDTSASRKDTTAADTLAAGATADSTAKAAAKPDTATPELKEYLPSKLSSLKPDLRLIWTKPARLNVTMAMAVDTAGTDSVPFFRGIEKSYSDTSLLAPARSLLPGNIYKLTIPPSAVRDEHGNTAKGKAKKIPADKNNAAADTAASVDSANANAAADTTAADTTAIAAVDSTEIHTIEIILRTISSDSVCYRLQGVAECLAEKPDENRKWVYSPIGWQERFIARDKSGTFAFDTIPASKGVLMWFSDANGDNRVTAGKLIPWRSPESFFAAPDTIEAKARWEIEGVKVEGCKD